jgi:hypothetical protein
MNTDTVQLSAQEYRDLKVARYRIKWLSESIVWAAVGLSTAEYLPSLVDYAFHQFWHEAERLTRDLTILYFASINEGVQS